MPKRKKEDVEDVLNEVFGLIGISNYTKHPNWLWWENKYETGASKSELMELMKASPEYKRKGRKI